MARPEDSDSNAVFAALNLYRQMELEGRRPEIAVVGGHPTNTLMAQNLIRKRVADIVNNGGPYEFYIVSDGLDELLMAEVLRDLGPVAGIRRVVVEQSLGIEGSYVLLARYIKKALNDPKYSRYFVGVPGVLLTLFGILTIFGYLLLSLKVIAAILGIFMIIKGFNLEDLTWRAISGAATRLREGGPLQISGIALLAITLMLSIYYFILTVYTTNPIYVKVGDVVSYPLTAVIIGIMLYILITDVIFKLSRHSFDLKHEAETLVTLLFLTLGLYYLGQALASTPIPSVTLVSVVSSYIYRVLVGSGFVTLVLIGASIAAIIEIYYRATQG